MTADGAECVSATIFTREWSVKYADDPIAARFLVLRFDREDCVDVVPILCNEDELFSLLRQMRPPIVKIASDRGENIAELQALVERAGAPLQ